MTIEDQGQHQRVLHGGRAPVLQHPVAIAARQTWAFEYSRRIMRIPPHVGSVAGPAGTPADPCARLAMGIGSLGPPELSAG